MASFWADYRAAQRARRHLRRRQRLEALIKRLPPRGVVITPVSQTALRLEGYGYLLVWDPTHNTVMVPGEPGPKTMAPKHVAGEFRWRWKREGCP